MLTIVYASPNASIRKYFWAKLNEVNINEPWLIMGDFNCVLKDEERNSRGGASSSFPNWVTQRSLIDLGYVGHRYTRSLGVIVDTKRVARLDRGLSNDA